MEVLDRMLRSMRAAWSALGDWSERDGVGSVLTPYIPDRSLVNSVIYQADGLLAEALLEARERGNDISTLQATKMGEPVYARLGYRRFGAIQMWEKRRA